MKYVILIGDGMGDDPQPDLNGLTPLAYAKTPNMDRMARNGLLGRARTVPEGMPPGSDVAIMSLMGYSPKGVLTGRGPLEAASQGLSLSPGDAVFRVNLVHLELGSETVMRNHSAGNLSGEEGVALIEFLQKELPLTGGRRLHTGVGYRHLLVWPGYDPAGRPSYPPHDYRDQSVESLLNNPAAAPVMELVRASWPLLADHPVNRRRVARGLPPANSIWPWGAGRALSLKSYRDRWGLSGVTIAAVDLIKGLGVSTGLKAVDVPGVNGWLDTNFRGKVDAAREALRDHDLVLLHIEAPDEASHQGDLKLKVEAIELFDREVAGPLLAGLEDFPQYRVLLAFDHYTPVATTTHRADPISFLIYSRPEKEPPSGLSFSEAAAAETGLMVNSGPDLGRLFFGPEKCL